MLCTCEGPHIRCALDFVKLLCDDARADVILTVLVLVAWHLDAAAGRAFLNHDLAPRSIVNGEAIL